MSLIFDKYEILRPLAQGGMGEIFLARQVGVSGFERRVILKAMRPNVQVTAHAIDQFVDEARVAALLNHPNIVAIYEVGPWLASYYIAMEYVEGDHLGSLMSGAGRLALHIPYTVTARIIHDAAMALDYAHNACDPTGRPLKLVHRDVSPQNVLVTTYGHTKLVDFGIAIASIRESHTITGIVKGKHRYMAPEQARGEELDGRADQFALGIILWELCTGERLFNHAKSALEALKLILTEPIPAPTSVRPDVPLELEAIAMKMLQRSKQDRFARCADVVMRLETFLSSHGLVGTSEVGGFVARVLGKKIEAHARELESGDLHVPLEDTTDASPPLPRALSRPRPPPLPIPALPLRPRKRSPAIVAAIVLGTAAGAAIIALTQQPRELRERPATHATMHLPTTATTAVLPAPVPDLVPVPVPAIVEPQPSAPQKTPLRSVAKAKGPGFLSIDTTPWTEVSIGAAHYGSTPHVRLPLPPGEHDVRLINVGARIDVERRVVIRAGETAKVHFTLQ